MKINIKNVSYKINSMVVMIILGILFSAGITFAAAVWQGTGWISNGSVISAGKIKTNFDYLYEQISNGGASFWSKSGSNVYYNGGKVGIGTTVPSSLFHINDDAAGGSGGLLVTGGGSGSTLAKFQRDVGSTGTITINASGGDPQMRLQSSSNTFSIGTDGNSFKISDNGAVGANDRFTIDSSGNIGIGTTAPGAKLEINGNEKITGNGILSSTNGNLVLYHPTSGSYSSIVFPSRSNYGSDYGYITYYDDNNNYNYWGDSGENSALILGTENDGANSVSDVVVLKGKAANIFDSGINYFTGNVGIGTTAPKTKLSVAGEITSTAANSFRQVYGNYGLIQRNDGGSYWMLSTASGNQYGGWNSYRPFRYQFANGDVTIANTITAKNSGNVGIGTTAPGAKLDVVGTIRGNYLQIDPQNTALEGGEMALMNSNPEVNRNGKIILDNYNQMLRIFRWKSNPNQYTEYAVFQPTKTYLGMQGNVGVGTASPSNKLEVAGKIEADGYCDRNGQNCKTASQIGGNTTQTCNTSGACVTNNSIVSYMNRKWYNVTGSRSEHTTYTNSKGYPIEVSIVTGPAGYYNFCLLNFQVSGKTISTQWNNNGNYSKWCSGAWTVPAGATYNVSADGYQQGSIETWYELY